MRTNRSGFQARISAPNYYEHVASKFGEGMTLHRSIVASFAC